MSQKKGNSVTGVLSSEQINLPAAAIPRAIIDRYKALEDLSGTISDVLDKLGIKGTVSASVLQPTITTTSIVGAAVTVRNVPQTQVEYQSQATKSNLMTEVEGINLCGEGDVLVIQGLRDISNMGGIMASLSKKSGLAGAVVDGGVRDVGQSRKIGFPIWSRDISPITGKWRCATVEVNGVVEIAGLSVKAGDLVIADETGTCFVPRNLVEEVLVLAEEITNKERAWLKMIDDGVAVDKFAAMLFKG